MPESGGGKGGFNEAFLAKQAWRLMEEKGSLLQRTLKACYYSHTHISLTLIGVMVQVLHGGVYWGAKSLLLEGLQWRVGNDKFLCVWDNVWVQCDSTVARPCTEAPFDPNM